jgi:hypothetical protein
VPEFLEALSAKRVLLTTRSDYYHETSVIVIAIFLLFSVSRLIHASLTPEIRPSAIILHIYKASRRQ